MNPKHAKTVVGKRWRGVRKIRSGCQKNFQCIGFDTETCHGQVYMIGLTDGERYESNYGLQRDHLKWFLRTLKEWKNKKATTVVFAHNHSFDWSVLLWPIVFSGPVKKSPRRTKTIVRDRGRDFAEIDIYWGRPCFGRLRFCDDPRRTIHLIDTYAFFTMGLKTALDTIAAPVRKLDQPAGLGDQILGRDELSPYLMNDVFGVWYLGKQILNWHREYDVPLNVSAPQLAGRIFRHCFMAEDFKRPYWPVRWWSMLSYHGGKVRMTGEPGYYENCYELDITSAYPEAMRQLPNFYDGRWKTVYGLESVHGIYRVTGTVKGCPWGSLHSHDFKPLSGTIENVWVTGYELHEAIRAGEFIPDRIFGVIWDPAPKQSGDNAFVRYVDHFFALKEAAPNSGQRLFYKLMLNSLYGKFIQRSWEEDEHGESYRQAGAMFHPFIATLITGYVNAKIHRMEHKYQAIHTATDSVKTLIPPDAADLGTERSGTDKLGSLKEEIFGDCVILRGKLYLHFNARWDGKDPKQRWKVGLHGYQGKPEDLLTMIRTGQRVYDRIRLTKWGEAWRSGAPVGSALRRRMILDLSPELLRTCAVRLTTVDTG